MQIGEILQGSTSPARAYRNNSKRNTVIELPEVIDNLIDDKAYRPKFRKLIEQGYMQSLVQLAELAPRMAKKESPSHWFAVCAAKKNWEKTLMFLAKMRDVARVTAEAASRIGAELKDMRVIYAAYWRAGGSIIRHAVAASETGRDKMKLFCWLVWKSQNSTSL